MQIRLGLILDRIEEGILVFDANERLLYLNRAASSLLRVPARFRKAQGARELLEKENPELFGIIHEVLAGAAGGGTVETVCRRGGRELKLRVHLEREEDGTLFLALQNITELWWLHRKEQTLLRRLHQNYKNLMESLRQIAESVAHEVRNPIVSIGGYANLLLRKCDTGKHNPDELRKYLEYIIADAERLNGIVAEVERYSDLSEARFTRKNIIPLIRGSFRAVRRLGKKRNLNIQVTDPEAKEYSLWMDSERLAAAIEEVLTRSATACPAGGHYIAETAFTPFEMSMRVEFDAAEIQESDIHFIFDPFYTTGGGVNLAAAQRTIVLHGGLIRASRRGATRMVLRLTLPGEKRLGRADGDNAKGPT